MIFPQLILIKITEHLDIINLFNFVFINKISYQYLIDKFNKRLHNYHFFLVTKNYNLYTQIINNILILSENNETTVKCEKTRLIIYQQNKKTTIQLSSQIFAFFRCYNDITFKLNISKLDQIKNNLQMFDVLYIYIKLNTSIIHIFIANDITKKIKIHYKLQL